MTDAELLDHIANVVRQYLDGAITIDESHNQIVLLLANNKKL